MRAAWIIAMKDLALRVRDRSLFVLAIIAPLVLALVFDVVFGGAVGGEDAGLDLSFGVVDLDGGPLSGSFVATLDTIAADGLATVTEFGSAEEAVTAVDAGEVAAVFVLPASMSDGYLAGGGAEIEIIGDIDAPTTVGIATSIADGFASASRTGAMAAATALAGGAIGPGDLAAVAEAAAAAPPPVSLGNIDAVTRQLQPPTSFVAGLAIFFMFFVAGAGVTSMLEERNDGTLGRLLVAPIGRGSILAGKSITSVIVGVGSMVVLVMASAFLMGAEWGPPLGVAGLVIAAVLAVVALMSLVGGLARTPEHSANLQAIVGVTFAMLGGTFVPIAPGEGILATLQYLTPNGLFVRGLGDLAGAGIAAAVPTMLSLLAIAAVAGVFAVVVTARRLQR